MTLQKHTEHIELIKIFTKAYDKQGVD